MGKCVAVGRVVLNYCLPRDEMSRFVVSPGRPVPVRFLLVVLSKERVP